MRSTRIYIGTTDGPTEVQRVTPEDPEVRSVVCLDGKAIALPISDDYDAFVRRPTGVIEALTGHSAYRTDISQPIGGGYSWQLGMAVAHVLAANNRLAGPDDRAREAVWLTGELDHHLSVGPVDDVALKLNRAASLLKGLIGGGTAATVVVPECRAEEAREALAAAFPAPQAAPRLVCAGHFDDVLSAIGAPRSKSPLARGGLRRKRGNGKRRAGLLAVASAATAAAVISVAALAPEAAGPVPAGEATPPASAAVATIPSSAAPHVALIETRAPEGRGCAAVHFKHARPVISRRVVASSRETAGRQDIRPDGLCDLRHRVVNPGLGSLSVAAIAARHDGAGKDFRTRALIFDHILASGATVDLDARPPRAIAKPLVQNLVLVAMPKSWPQAEAHLRRAIKHLGAATSPDAWRRAVGTLAEQAFFVTTAQEIFRPEAVLRKTVQTLP